MKATAHFFSTLLDMARLRLDDGTRPEAGHQNEAPPCTAVQRWEEMANHQTLRVIGSFLSLQGVHDLGLTCQPLHRLLLLPFSPTAQAATEGSVTTSVGAPVRTDWCVKRLAGPAAATGGRHPKVVSLTLSPEDNVRFAIASFADAFSRGRFQHLQVLEVGEQEHTILSSIFSAIAPHLASGRAPHLRTLALAAPSGFHKGTIDVGSLFQDMHDACTLGHLANVERLVLHVGHLKGR